MTYIKIGDTKYPATISGKTNDRDWDGRESKAITLEMGYAEAMALFTDGLAWSIVYEQLEHTDESGNVVPAVLEEYDNSEYDVAGPITDNRDGTVTVKMGKPTDGEKLAVAERDLAALDAAYAEGVRSA